jgi:surface antigen
MDAADRREANQATHRALETTPSGTPTAWRNPDNGHSGTVTPVSTYQAANGQYCREYRQTIDIDGERKQAHGKACREPDGSWRIAQ